MALSTEAATRKDQGAGTARLEHRHFATIARIIGYIDADKRIEVAKHFADNLSSTNSNFDRERFLRACSVICR